MDCHSGGCVEFESEARRGESREGWHGLSLGSLVTKVRFLLPKPKRKYEVDESSWLVIKGRAILKWLDKDGHGYLHSLQSYGLAALRWSETEARVTRSWLGVHWPVFAARARFSMRRVGLALRWRRIPKVWEMAFIDRMKAAERMGIPFWEVLRDTLPETMGIDGTRVLGYWTGRKSMFDPETFVRETAKLFGKSSKQVVIGIFDGLDERKLLVKNAPEEPKLQSLVEAINRADEQRAMLREMRVRKTTAIVPAAGPADP